ncbi:MAG TPA: hypothetical protein VIT85_05395 [Solirubrobacterales bacterium]
MRGHRQIGAALLRATDKVAPAEVLGILVVLTAAGLIAYGSYIGQGGFYADDWHHVAFYRFADSPQYWSTVETLSELLGGRPLVTLLMPLPQVFFGADVESHLALALVLGIVVSFCLYLALRTLRMAPLHAGTIAVLALIFPRSDGVRLWATGSILSISVIFFLLGLVLALRGLKHPGRRGIAMHAGADALYLLSVLTYEATAGAAALAGALYLGMTSTGRAVRLWLADLVVVMAALSYSLVTTSSHRGVGTWSERISDVGPFLRQSFLVLPDALLPVGASGRVFQGLALLGVAAIVGAAVFRVRRGSEPALRGWLLWIAGAAIAIAAAYVVFLGSHLYPQDSGINTRIQVFAGLAYVVLAYAIVATACHLLLRSVVTAALVTALAGATIAVGYGFRLAEDQTLWKRAATEQQNVLRAIDGGLGTLPRRSTLLAFNLPEDAGPGVPVFTQAFDLAGALQLHANDPTLRAYPLYEGVSVQCEQKGLAVEGPGAYGTFDVNYRRTYFLDVRGGRGKMIRTPSACAAALGRISRTR